MGRSNYMTEEHRKELESAYDSLQSTYKTMMAEYKTTSDTLPADLQSLYTRMQNMHRQMDTNHRQMMANGMGRHMEGRGMMSEEMGMRMQGHMTGEWYNQMMSMHRQMATMHDNRGQKQMADLNHRLSQMYNKMMQIIPGLNEPTDRPFNEKGDPSLLNGESLYTQNCASCHGNNAKGVSGVFPPLVNSKWVTEDKSIPIQILLHGLQGEVEVQGQTYQGVMPSFKAR
ncbi:MAG: cytochrome c, partial [Balneolaceae bacterium]